MIMHYWYSGRIKSIQDTSQVSQGTQKIGEGAAARTLEPMDRPTSSRPASPSAQPIGLQSGMGACSPRLQSMERDQSPSSIRLQSKERTERERSPFLQIKTQLKPVKRVKPDKEPEWKRAGALLKPRKHPLSVSQPRVIKLHKNGTHMDVHCL